MVIHEMWKGVVTLSFHLKERPVRLLVRNLCLIPQPCLRLRSTAADLFPGSGFPVFAVSDRLRPLPDSSSTGGVCCVSGRIPALSVSDFMHHALYRIGVFACAHDIAAMGRAECGRYPFRSAPGRVCPACLKALCSGMRKLLDQKRKQILTVDRRESVIRSAARFFGFGFCTRVRL